MLMCMRVFVVLAACCVVACGSELGDSTTKGDGAAEAGDASDGAARVDGAGIDADVADERRDAGCFVWTDQMCPLGGSSCTDVGDGLCHAICESDADCVDPAFPHCSVQGLWKGGDFGCNGEVLICRSKSVDDCERRDASFF